MKSSDDVQIQSVAARANRGRRVLKNALKPSPVDRSACGVLAANRFGSYRPNLVEENVSGNQRADVSDFRKLSATNE
jgi:hypothetical protein